MTASGMLKASARVPTISAYATMRFKMRKRFNIQSRFASVLRLKFKDFAPSQPFMPTTKPWQSKAWKERRAEILKTRTSCERCGSTKQPLVIDHIRKRRHGEAWERYKKLEDNDFEVHCKKCAFIYDGLRKILCQTCKKNYHSIRYNSCYSCNKEEELEADAEIAEIEAGERFLFSWQADIERSPSAAFELRGKCGMCGTAIDYGHLTQKGRCGGCELKVLTSMHEAGHAVMCVLRDVPLDYVTIVPSEGGMGHYKIDLEKESLQAKSQEEKLESCVFVHFAGVEAAKLFGWEYEATAEFEEADRVIDAMVHSDRRLSEKKRKRILRETHKLLKPHINTITALADALLERNTMNGEEVRKLVENCRS